MRYGLSYGDLAELESMPVSTNGNSYADFMRAAELLRAGMEPSPAPRAATHPTFSVMPAPEYPQANQQPSWLQED